MLTVDAKTLGIFRAQRIGLRQYRAFIEMHQLHRHRARVAERRFRRVEPLAQIVSVQLQQRANIACQIHHNYRVTVVRVPGDGRYPARIAAPCTKHAGNVHQRLHLNGINQRRQLLLTAVGVEIIEHPRLAGFHQLRHGDGGVHIRHRVVRVGVFNPVGDG